MKRIFGRATLAGLGAALALAACGTKKAQAPPGPPPAIPVAVYRVRQQAVVGTDEYPGTVVPLNEVEVRAEVGGFLTDLYVQDGQHVRKGQPLYAIDRTRYQAAYDEALATLQTAQTNYVRVAKDDARYRRLAEQDAISGQQVDVSKADLANAASQIARARAALRAVALDLRHAVLRAALTGTIGLAQVKQGGLVTQGTTLLNTLSEEDPIGVDFTIIEADIPRFVQLQGNPLTVRDSVFTLQLAGDQPYATPGKIKTIDRALDPQTGTLKVRVEFANPQRVLKAGMNTALQVLNPDTGNQLVIPSQALTEQLGEFYVYVVGDSSKVHQRKVVTGTQTKGLVVVRSGLKANETIVRDGLQNLQDGATIRVGNPNAPAPAGRPTAAK